MIFAGYLKNGTGRSRMGKFLLSLCFALVFLLLSTAPGMRAAAADDSPEAALTSRTVRVLWEDKNDAEEKRPAQLEATLWNGSEKVTNPALKLNAANNWTATVGDLPEGKYKWTVSDSASHFADDYALLGKKTDSKSNTTTFTYGIAVSEAITAVWDEDGYEQEIPSAPLKFELLANGESVRLKKGEDGTWSVVTDDKTEDSDPVTLSYQGEKRWSSVVIAPLPKYSGDSVITYSWRPLGLPECYSGDSDRAAAGETGTRTTVKLHYTPVTTESTVVKNWDDADNQDGKRPESLLVTLTVNGEATEETAVLNAENGWSATVGNLPKYSAGQKIAYSWAEEDPGVYEHTDTTQEGTVTTLTNSYTPETTEMTVEIVWDDSDANPLLQHPEKVSIELLCGDEPVETVDLEASEDDSRNWKASVDSLPKYDDGKPLSYAWNTESLPDGCKLLDTQSDGAATTLTLGVEAPETSFALNGTKTLSGRAFKSGDRWTFSITPQDGAPAPKDASGEPVTSVTVSPTGGNTVSFSLGTLSFSIDDLDEPEEPGEPGEPGEGEGGEGGEDGEEEPQVQTFLYTVAESGSVAGVTNDPNSTRVLKIEVEAQEDGTVVVRYAQDSANLSFTNTYEAEGRLYLSAVKVLVGRDEPLEDGEFSFQLLSGSTVRQTKTNDEDGVVTFNSLRFTLDSLKKDAAGNPVTSTATYRIKEVVPEDKGDIIYDTTTYTIKVTVSDNGDGTLSVVPDKNGDDIEFINIATYTLTYNPNGGKWGDGSTKKVTDKHPVTEAAKIKAAPTRAGYVFAGWKCNKKIYQAGKTYNEKNSDGYYVDGTLTAQWRASGRTPVTGDNAAPGLWALAGLCSAAGVVWAFRRLRRKPGESR